MIRQQGVPASPSAVAPAPGSTGGAAVPALQPAPTIAAEPEFWPTLLREVGPDEVRGRLLTEWTTTGVLSALVASISTAIFLEPPEAEGRLREAIGAATGISVLFCLYGVALSTLLTLQVNTRVQAEDQKAFLKRWGPVILINVIAMMSGVVMLVASVALVGFAVYSYSLALVMAVAVGCMLLSVGVLFMMMNYESMVMVSRLHESQREQQMAWSEAKGGGQGPG